MANLVARRPAEGRLPITMGDMTLSEAEAAPITWIASFRGQEAGVAAELGKLGLGLPAPGELLEGKGARAVWAGPGQALILGAAVTPTGAAVADQSDAWTWLVLDGPGARAVLARLVPADLRDKAFPEGRAMRTLLFHMTATLIRSGPERSEILVFRSMAATAVHDIERAMAHLAGRGAL